MGGDQLTIGDISIFFEVSIFVLALKVDLS